MGLEGKTILITRQRDQSLEVVSEIEKRGGKAVLLPLINIQDPDSWEELDQALSHVKQYDALIFTSSNAVERFFHRCLLRSIEPVTFRECDVYAVGAKTKELIEARGLHVNATPERFSSVALAEYFDRSDVTGKRFLYPRGDLGTADLVKRLVQKGARVEPVIVYKNTGPDEADVESTYHRLAQGEIDVITFASPSAGVNFVKLFPPERIASMEKKARIAVVGPTTEEAVRKLGLQPDIIAARATMTGMLDAIEEYFHAIE